MVTAGDVAAAHAQWAHANASTDSGTDDTPLEETDAFAAQAAEVGEEDQARSEGYALRREMLQAYVLARTGAPLEL